jgi:hypothetical protein
VIGYGSSAASKPIPEAAPSRPAAVAPPAARAESAAALPVGTAEGTLTLDGRVVSLTHVVGFSDATTKAISVVISDVALTAAQARSVAQLEKMMQSGKLRAVSASIDPVSKAVLEMHVFDPTHRYSVYVAPSNRRFEGESVAATGLMGQLSTIRPGAFAGAPYEVAATFNVDIKR